MFWKVYCLLGQRQNLCHWAHAKAKRWTWQNYTDSSRYFICSTKKLVYWADAKAAGCSSLSQLTLRFPTLIWHSLALRIVNYNSTDIAPNQMPLKPLYSKMLLLKIHRSSAIIYKNSCYSIFQYIHPVIHLNKQQIFWKLHYSNPPKIICIKKENKKPWESAALLNYASQHL